MGHDAADAVPEGGTAVDPAGLGPRPGNGNGSGHGSGHGAGRHVLVVEDEPNISEAIRFILRRDGWAVTVYGSGNGALEQVAALAPHLVILDVMLPGVSGLDILRGLRGQRETADLPVILLTAKGSAQVRETARAAGASMFMAKPFANADLLAAVRQLVGA